MNVFQILPVFIESWAFAITLIIVGVIVVFAALALLVIILKSMPALGNIFTRVPGLSKPFAPSKSERIPAQVSAAIAAAVYLYLDEVHDKESGMMTIRKVSRTYSPWSSKIYGLNIFKK